MSSNNEDGSSGVRTWFRNLSWVRKLIAGVVAVAAAVGAIAGAVEATGNLIERWESNNKATTSLIRTPTLGLEFWQNETRAPMAIEDPAAATGQQVVEVTMERAPFEIRLPKQEEDVGVQIVAWTDDSIFEIEPGDRALLDTPGLGVVKSMFTYQFGTGSLTLSKEANNNFRGDTRTPINGQDSIFVSAVVPRNFHLSRQETSNKGDTNTLPPSPLDKEDPAIETYTPLAELREDLFLVVFIDKDKGDIFGPDIVGPGEYEYIILRF